MKHTEMAQFGRLLAELAQLRVELDRLRKRVAELEAQLEASKERK
jgi:regulator of replication initiation timing